MDILLHPQKLSGTICAINSKSQAHRILICAAFADQKTCVICPQTNDDIEATAECLRALGACIDRNTEGYTVIPVKKNPKTAELFCKESGSTLRFMLPIAGALGVDTVFHLEGRLPQRPLSPLWEVMEEHGCNLTWITNTSLRCTGRLTAGNYSIRGNVSSQFITGLLFALSMVSGKSHLTILGNLESAPYVEMTREALNLFGVETQMDSLCGRLPFSTPGSVVVEGDWSNGAFFLAAAALGNAVTVDNLNPNSVQGDRKIASLLPCLADYAKIDGADIPDLIPILSVVAAASKGAVFTNIARLRLKESDRVATVCAMLQQLGIQTKTTENSLEVLPGKFHSCTIDSAFDHRIAMAAAIASTITDGPVMILHAECVKKSYPGFWDDFKKLGGHYEQYLR